MNSPATQARAEIRRECIEEVQRELETLANAWARNPLLGEFATALRQAIVALPNLVKP